MFFVAIFVFGLLCMVATAVAAVVWIVAAGAVLVMVVSYVLAGILRLLSR